MRTDWVSCTAPICASGSPSRQRHLPVCQGVKGPPRFPQACSYRYSTSDRHLQEVGGVAGFTVSVSLGPRAMGSAAAGSGSSSASRSCLGLGAGSGSGTGSRSGSTGGAGVGGGCAVVGVSEAVIALTAIPASAARSYSRGGGAASPCITAGGSIDIAAGWSGSITSRAGGWMNPVLGRRSDDLGEGGGRRGRTGWSGDMSCHNLS